MWTGLLLLVISGLAAASPKRGFVAVTANSTCSDPSLLLARGCAWYYSYSSANAYVKKGCALSPEAAEAFVPMNWCISNVNDTVPAGVNTTFFLGFNEPNIPTQCNMLPRDVAIAWGDIMRRHNGSILISPAPAGHGIVWLTAFFQQCVELYGPTGCNISRVAAHSYSCNVNSTMTYMQSLYEAFKMPIWITEFACGDHTQKRPLSDQETYMRAIVPVFDATSYIERYAWMAARQPDARGLLGPGEAASLSELGAIYVSL
eukprot:m.119770 g.119770  ORF g.119770 m.119770 type:complete len:260 (+) comp9260_c0_seq9:24-803(+)